MGNFLNRRRDPSANNAKTAATEQKPAEEPAATQPAQESEATQIPEAVKTENIDMVAGDPATVVASLPPGECASECKEVKAPAVPLNDAEPESVAKETSTPDQLEPLTSVSEPSPSEPEPKPVAEAQLAPEPAPEVISEPEPTSNPEAEVEVEAVPEPLSESAPAPAEALEQPADVLTQESLPEPMISSPALIDLGVPDATPQPINTPPPPAPIPAPVDADEPSDIPAVAEECHDSAEVPVTSTLELETSEETSESLEKSMEVEASGTLEQLVSNVNEESVNELLQNLELKGNDLVADLIPTDVKIPDDSPITDMSTSTELM
ncbi:predicted GPI-anchored protein 58 [Chelmon rostratus]|uniref:predicted GPI-anchored protein 58 n=1 Tax=Chelmon rostratus TaxID=109905 RepID=UPI001BEBE173|nr:predicted GPI-anchored protein 58 [Chelmon rostratus]